jgi:hypothetical protein
MPIHDWTRVDHGTFHDFHQGWAVEIRSALNGGLLPAEYEATVERSSGAGLSEAGPVSQTPAIEEIDPFARLRNAVVVRDGERAVAAVEIVSPGNKSSRHAIQAFVRKVAGAIGNGIHVLVVDLFPPGPRDPGGIHPVIWSEFRDEKYAPPAGKNLTLVAYEAGPTSRAYIQPAAVGDPLPDMPLFLAPGLTVNVPLEATYAAAFEGITRRTRDLLSAPG